jgi:hypothetical protein
VGVRVRRDPQRDRAGAVVTTYRVGNHQPQNLYRDDQYIGVMFSPIDAAAVVEHLNRIEECDCESYDPCAGECCGVGMCSCSQPQVAQ